MPHKVCILIDSSDRSRKGWDPFLDAGGLCIGKFWNDSLESSCFEFFLQPREPSFFRGPIPAVYDDNSLHMLVIMRAPPFSSKYKKGRQAVPRITPKSPMEDLAYRYIAHIANRKIVILRIVEEHRMTTANKTVVTYSHRTNERIIEWDVVEEQ